MANRFVIAVALLLSWACHSASYTPTFSLLTDSSSVVNSKYDSAFVHRALLDIGVEANWGKAWQGFANAQAQRGDDGSAVAGDIQAYSNIDAENYTRLSEYWLNYSQAQWRFKFGQVDVNSEFAYVDFGGEFIQSSMGFSPTIFVMPTFPRPAWGAMAFYQFNEQTNIGFAISAANGQHDFDEQFYIANLRSALGNGELELGLWHHSGDFEQLSGLRSEKGALGIFATYNAQLNQTTGYFLQYGETDESVSEIYRHIGAGVQFSQPFGRENDISGVGVTSVWLSPDLNADTRKETSIEAFYLWQVSDHFSVKPDVQWIKNPSGNTSKGHPLVFTLRLNVAF